MKKTFQVFIALFSLTLFGQDYYDIELTRGNPKFKNLVLKTKKIKDSTGKTNYISNVLIYNEYGVSKLEYDLNKKGDTLEKIKTTFPTKSSEMEVHSYANTKSDTAYFFYDKNRLLKKELWKWGDDDEIDTYKFFYNNLRQLIKQEVYFGIEKSWDTLLYKNNKIKTVLSYNNLSQRKDSTEYIYNGKNQLSKTLKYNLVNKLIESSIFKSNSNGKFVKITKESEQQNENKKYIIKYKYHSTGEIKIKKIKVFINGRLEYNSELNYSELGIPEKYRNGNFTEIILKD